MADKFTVGELVYKISGDVDNLKTELKKANTQINKLKGTMEKGQSVTNKMTKGFSNLKKAVAGYLSIQAVKRIGQQIFELGKNASAVDSLRISFDRLSEEFGFNSQEILNNLRDLSVGTITTKDLIVSANRAMVLGVAGSTEEFGELMQIARLRARDMGITTQQAFDNIVTGIGRSSPLILDNLGIVIKANEAYERYGESLGKTAQALSDNERREALKFAVLESGNKAVAEAGELNLTYAEQLQQMTVSVEELRVELGEKLLPALVDVTSAIVEAIDLFTGAEEITADYEYEVGRLNATLKKLEEEEKKIADGTNKLTQEQIDSAKASTKQNIAIEKQEKLVKLLAEAQQLGGTKKKALKILDEEHAGLLNKRLNPAKKVALFLSTKGIANSQIRIKEEKQLLAVQNQELHVLQNLKTAYRNSEVGLEAFNKMLKEERDALSKSTEEARKNEEALEKQKEAQEKARQELESFQDQMLSMIDTAKGVREALEKDLTKSFNKFGDSLKTNFADGVDEFASIVLNAEEKIADLKKELLDVQGVEEVDVDRVSDIQSQIAEQEEILNARVGFEERQAKRIEEIRQKLEDAGIDASQVGLDNLLSIKTLEEQIQEERRIADLDAFTRFEEEQVRQLQILTDNLIAEVTILREKIEKQKEFEQELTDFLLEQNSVRTDSVDEFANNAIAKYGEMAKELEKVISKQKRLNALRGVSVGGGDLPPFSAGGYVDSRGGEVHAGEYVIPANLVQQFGSLVSALDGVRTGGGSSSTTNNRNINAPITMNNTIENPLDIRALGRELGFEVRNF